MKWPVLMMLAGCLIAGCSPPPDYWKKAQTEYAAQDFLGCILALNQLLEQQPESDSVLVLRANCYNRIEKHEKAEKDLKRAIQINPSALGAKLGYAQLLAYRGDTTEALKLLVLPPALKSGRTVSALWLERAKLLFYAKHTSESLQCLNQAIEADGSNPEAWFLRGAFYASDLTDSALYFKPHQAVNDYLRAIALRPSFAEAYFKLAMTELDEFSDVEAGMSHLNDAIQFDPYNEAYYLERARRFNAQGARSAAIRDFKKVLQLNPLDSTANAEVTSR